MRDPPVLMELYLFHHILREKCHKHRETQDWESKLRAGSLVFDLLPVDLGRLLPRLAHLWQPPLLLEGE